MARRILLAAAVVGTTLLSACTTAPSAPVEIGANTYYMSQTNVAGAFGDVGTLAQGLMLHASKFCAKKGLHLQVAKTTLTQPLIASRPGGASIQFECLEHPGPVPAQSAKGVSTVTAK